MIEIKNFSGRVIHIVQADTLVGADLSEADLSEANLREANLREANLREAYLRKADLRWADLRWADLSSAYLSEADLRWANLSRAYLSEAIVRPKAPIVPDLDRKILEAVSREGCSLDMSTWHTCETTHCRAGWAIVLAGAEGKDLEKMLGSNVAGALIYHASTGRVPNFFASNEDALEDIKRCAGE